MKRQILKCSCVVLGLAVVFMSGCSSSGMKRSEKTLASAQLLRKDFEGFKVQIDKTVVALGNIETVQADRLKSAYRKYSSETGKLDSQSKRIISRSKDLTSNSRKYIEAWEKQLADVRNTQLREQAEQRRARASEELENTKDELQRIKPEYEKFYTGLSELKSTLENDLNPAGVASVKDVMTAVKANAEPLKNDIDTIIAGLDQIIVTLSGA